MFIYTTALPAFAAAIKTDESQHVLQTDQGNHIHQ